jgi:fatty-acid desaturase
MSFAKQNWTASFYWIGVAMTLASLSLILAGNTELVWRFEHRRFPLSWAFAGVGVLAFLVAELSHRAFSPSNEGEEGSLRLSPELEAAES